MATVPAVARSGDMDFLERFLDLLPEGEVWSRELDSVQNRALLALMGTWRRLTARDGNLLVDAFPPTTLELLHEWELTLGLPDECTPLNATYAARLAAVVAKLVADGGQSTAYYVRVAAAFGYTITITEFSPAGVGIIGAGPPSQANTWRINADMTTVTSFRVGTSVVGDRLREWGDSQLECVIRRVMPAHTVLLFSYTVPL